MSASNDIGDRNLRYAYDDSDLFAYTTVGPVGAAELDTLRNEAQSMIREVAGFGLRSCWLCNNAHSHFLAHDQDWVLNCFDCGRYFFRRVDITIYDDDHDGGGQ